MSGEQPVVLLARTLRIGGGAERQLAALGFFTCARYVFQNPLELRARKISVEHEARLLLDHRCQPARLEPVTRARRTSILPDDGVADRLARSAIPHHRRLALVRDADGGDVRRTQARAIQRLVRCLNLRGPDFLRIVLHPARLWKNLPELLLRDGDDAA